MLKHFIGVNSRYKLIINKVDNGYASPTYQDLFMYYVYLIKSVRQNKIYVGYTNDLRRRLNEHNTKQGGKYTKNKGPFELIYYEAYKSRKDAERREDALKLHKKAYAQLKTRIIDSLNGS